MNKKGFVLLFILIAFIIALKTPLRAAPTFPILINAGSSLPYTDQQGRVFEADQAYSTARGYGYIGGTSFAPRLNHPVGGSEDDLLFDMVRHDWQEYRITDLSNGSYLVTLYFVEVERQGPNLNVFDISAEGNLVAPAIDVAAEVGVDYITYRRFIVPVSDGTLNIVANATAGVSTLGALEIDVYDGANMQPVSPTNVTNLPLYNALGVEWNAVGHPLLTGYHIFRTQQGGGNPVQLTTIPHTATYWVDHDALPTQTYRYTVVAETATGMNSASSAPSAWATPLTQADVTLPVYEITISDDNLQTLYEIPETDDELPATFTFAGETYNAEVRFRGFSGRRFPKKSWEVVFPDDAPFPVEHLNLNAEFYDWTLMRSEMSGRLFEATGINPPTMEHIALFVNGEYWGVYTSAEQVDEHFLTRSGRSPTANIYKATAHLMQYFPDPYTYYEHYEKKTNRGIGFDDLVVFHDLINNTPDEYLLYELRQVFDVDSYLRYYAIIVLSGNTDFTWHNAYLVHDLEAGMWELIPWDWDHSWGLFGEWSGVARSDYAIDFGSADSTMPLEPPNPLLTRLLALPETRQAYCQQLSTLLATTFRTSVLDPQINAVHTALLDAGIRDWRKFPWQDEQLFLNGPTEFHDYIVERRAFIAAEMQTFCPSTQPFLKVNEILVNNAGAFCDPDAPAECNDSWVEIYNAGFVDVDLQGFYLSDSGSNLNKHQINTSITIPAGGHHVFWVDGQPAQGQDHLNFVLGSAEIYLTAPDGTTGIDTISDPSPQSNIARGRTPDGIDQWRDFRVPTIGASNLLRGPVITAVHTPTLPTATDAVTVTTTITDDGQVVDRTFTYLIDGLVQQTVPLTLVATNTYQAVIPAQASKTRVQYWISADDNDAITTYWPADALNEPYEYIVDYVSPALQLSEIVPDNDTLFTDPNEPDEYPDWFEIFNPTAHVVNLSGLTITDDVGEPDQFAFNEEISVPPNGFRLFFADDDIEQGILHTNFKIANDGEELALFDQRTGALIDGVAFGAIPADDPFVRCADGWQALPPATPHILSAHCPSFVPFFLSVEQTPTYPAIGESIEIIARVLDSSMHNPPVLWYSTGGAYQSVPMILIGGLAFRAEIPAQATATPVHYYVTVDDVEGLSATSPADAPTYTHNTVVGYEPPPILINEAMPRTVRALADPDEAGEYPDWIELVNLSNQPVALDGLYLTNDPAQPTLYPIPDGIVIPPQGFVVFYADDDALQSDLHTNFKLSALYGEVALFGADGNALIDWVSWNEVEGDQSFGRNPDGDPNWQLQACATPGESNSCRALYLPILEQ